VTVEPVALEPDFASRLARAAGPGVEVRQVQVMPGGHSGLTHRVTLDGLAGLDEVVVKSTPPGRPARGRHDVSRQARVIRALQPVDGVPVAEVYFEDTAHPPFFATACVPGVAVDPVIAEDDSVFAPALVAARWDAAIDVLAELHRLVPERLDIGADAPREPGEELELWCQTMRAGGMDCDPAFARLRDAMLSDVPTRSRIALIHGDFRLGNILFTEAEPRAVIDWEIWSLGDPLVDLAWLVQFTDGANFPGIGQSVDGTPSAAEVLDRYARLAAGRRQQTEWFVALGCLKLAAIQAHNRRRHLDGRFYDPFQAMLGPSIDRHLRRGLQTLAG
jgi:aminoglycoside phosphotransferase (APT) family kinase protein